MSIKIIGVGLGRTGTLSTQHALNELGYNCYHMMEVMKKYNRSHLDFWLKIAESPEGTPHNWDKVFQNYDATVDYPGTCVWKDLVAAYPDAKVILTHHPKGTEGWYKSNMETIYRNEKMWELKILGLIIPPVRKMKNMASKLVWGRFMKGTMEDKTAAINRYHEHTQEVKSQIPPGKLLIFSVDQGWAPLCEFLGKEIPQTAFPRANDKATMQKRQRQLSLFVRALVTIVAIIIIALIWRLMN